MNAEIATSQQPNTSTGPVNAWNALYHVLPEESDEGKHDWSP